MSEYCPRCNREVGRRGHDYDDYHKLLCDKHREEWVDDMCYAADLERKRRMEES